MVSQLSQVFWHAGCVSADEIDIDAQLFREIAKGHKFLEQSTENLSGTILTYRDLRELDFPVDTKPSRHINFYKKGDLLRVDCVYPMEGTTVLPGHPYNDITDVFLHTKDYDYRYMAVFSTGVPYANLLKSKVPYEDVQLALRSDYHQNVNFLFSLQGMRVLQMLQLKIGKVERRAYSDVPDAVWITGDEEKGENGDIAYWVIVLNPNQHYALLYHEGNRKSKKPNKSITFSNKIVSQKLNDGKLFPKQIIFESQVFDLHRLEKNQITITSTEKPDDKLFSEAAFKEMGRDYVVVNVLPNQKQVPDNLLEAAPLQARMTPEHYAVKNIMKEMVEPSYWSLTRILLLVSGIVLLVIAFFQLLSNRKRKQSRDKTKLEQSE
jgi:hypothetical protein